MLCTLIGSLPEFKKLTFITGDSPIKSNKLFIRPKGLLILALASISLYLYSRFVFDNQVKIYLEREFSELNGAKVNIGSLQSDLLRGKFTLSNIEFGNPVTPMRNTFEIGEITTRFAVAPIFKRKFHIQDMKIEGVKYWTQRREPGDFTEDMSADMVRAALMDRASAGIYSGIKNELLDNPLRHLGQLGSGFTLSSKLGIISDRLQSVRHLRGILNTLRDRESDWERQKADLPSPAVISGLKDRLMSPPKSKYQKEDTTSKEELESRIQSVQADLEKLTKQISDASSELSNADQFLPSDISLVRRELGLPNTSHQDLTNLVFGPAWLGFLEKLSYWLEFSRSKSPVGTKTDTYSIAVYTHDKFRAIRFGKLGATPAFVLEKATIRSGNPQNSEVKIEGELTGFNTNPRLYGKPAVIQLHADYPEKGFRHLELKTVIDHTQDIPTETIHLSVEAFKLMDWPISRTPDVQLKIDKARGGITLDGDFKGDQINIEWNISLSEAEYEIHSRFRQVEQALEQMLAGLYSFDVTGKISGQPKTLSFDSSSGLGRRLAEGLKSEFKHEHEALNEAIANETRSLFPPIKEEISIRIKKLQEETLPAFQQALKQLQSIQAQIS
ncbi:MAG: TIGR03545 family protein [Pseudomonadota bacterium]